MVRKTLNLLSILSASMSDPEEPPTAPPSGDKLLRVSPNTAADLERLREAYFPLQRWCPTCRAFGNQAEVCEQALTDGATWLCRRCDSVFEPGEPRYRWQRPRLSWDKFLGLISRELSRSWVKCPRCSAHFGCRHCPPPGPELSGPLGR